MLHISIEGFSITCELDVPSTDVVDPILEEHSENLDDPEESRSYEPAFIIGRDVPLNEGKTFAECGIEHGDTLYHLLGLSKPVVNEPRSESGHVTIVVWPVSQSSTVGNLIDKIRDAHSENPVTKVPRPLLCLRLGDEILDESKTLNECNITNHSVVRLSGNGIIEISIGVPIYANMERVLFKPGDTIADLKKEVESMMPGFEYTAGIRPAYPVPLKSVVYENKTTHYCVYLDLFCERMWIFVTEYKMMGKWARTGQVGHLISSESTFNDVHRIIRMQLNDSEMGTTFRFGKWNMKYVYDCAWKRAFAPQMTIVPLSSSMVCLPLFFFPLRIQIFRSVQVDLSTTAEEFAASFYKERFGLEGVQRFVYHPRSNQFLIGYFYAHYDKLWSDGESYSVLLTNPHLVTSPRIERGTAEGITVLVRSRKRITCFQVRSTDTINTLRDKIEQHVQVPFYLQKLMFRGNPVQSNSTFREMGIGDCSIVELLLSEDFEILKFLLQ